VTALRKENMRIRQLEADIKALTRQKEKIEEQAASHLVVAKEKLEK